MPYAKSPRVSVTRVYETPAQIILFLKPMLIKCNTFYGVSGQSLDDLIIETPSGVFCFVTGHSSLVVHSSCCYCLFVLIYFEQNFAVGTANTVSTSQLSPRLVLLGRMCTAILFSSLLLRIFSRALL